MFRVGLYEDDEMIDRLYTCDEGRARKTMSRWFCGIRLDIGQQLRLERSDADGEYRTIETMG